MSDQIVETTISPYAPAVVPGITYVAEAFQPKGYYTRDKGTSSVEPLVIPNNSNKKLDRNLKDKEHSRGIKNSIEHEEEGIAGTNMNDEAPLPPPLEHIKSPWFQLTPIEEIPSEADILEHDVGLLHKAHHGDPFAVLGPHFFDWPGKDIKAIIIRVWKKDAREVLLRPLENHYFQLTNNDVGWIPTIQRSEWLFQIAFHVKLTEAGRNHLLNLSNNVNNASNDHDTPSCDIINDILVRTPLYYDAKVKYHGDSSDDGYAIRDAYNFGLLAPDFDLKFFQAGSCWHVDNLMGSHLMKINGVSGVRFTVWAPNALFLSVVGDWNQWDGRAHPMRRRVEFGIWELFVPNIGAGQNYGYRIHSKTGQDFIKIDPYAQCFQDPPQTASVTSRCDDAFKLPNERFQWTDQDWMEKRILIARNKRLSRQPMSIYEVHLPSWMRGDENSYLGYRELAHRLVDHMKRLNFTHVEFLPLAHHPFEGSWGYQVSGQYAPYSRLGSADDLKYLINELHRNNIGVFLDFVPAHFVKDSWGLVHYDGEPCYEYADPREGEHKGWGTMMYNFRRNEVRSFLLGAAYHWLRRYHIDGLRIDAVSSMIYKNHCREPGDWIPNEYGGDANLQAISLLQELNWVIHHEFPGVFTMAEESTAWPGVTDEETGLGFDAKWDLGWMNDTLSYLCTPAMERWKKHSKLTFRGLYMGNEKWVLPLSHDEVVSGKGSLLDKCGFRGAPFEERLQTLKALYGFQVCMPGRPLLFMGAEFGQGREWKEARSVDWHESEEPARKQVMQYVSDLLNLYRKEKALHAGDDEPWNFQWVDCDNAQDCIVGWIRKYGEWTNDILTIVNFAGIKYSQYPVGVPHGGEWVVLVNSDDWKYGGTMIGAGAGVKMRPSQGGRLGWPYCLWIDIPPFGCLILKAPQLTEVDDYPILTEDKKKSYEEAILMAKEERLKGIEYQEYQKENPTINAEKVEKTGTVA